MGTPHYNSGPPEEYQKPQEPISPHCKQHESYARGWIYCADCRIKARAYRHNNMTPEQITQEKEYTQSL